VDASDVAEEQGEPVAESSSALVQDLGAWTDDSGTVVFHLFRCDWVGPASTNNAYCSVKAGYVATGGGAEIEGEGDPGALLTGSTPFIGDPTSTWMASSSDNTVAYPHRLRAYVIGMALSGLTRLDLIHAMTWTTATSGTTDHPVVTAFPPTGMLIGGGAYTPTPGQYLVGSDFSAQDTRGWMAQSKDHLTAAPGHVTATAIGIARCPAKYVGQCLVAGRLSLATFIPSGYSPAYSYSAPNALVSIGGMATYNGAGRMLADLFPKFNSAPRPVAAVRSKDHVYPDSGMLTGTAYSLSNAP